MSAYTDTIEQGKRDWFQAIGEFVNAFEHLCLNMRMVIYRDIGNNTYESQTKILTLMSTLGARDLGDTLTRLLRRTDRLPKGDPTEKLIDDFQKLNATRNHIVHTAWFIGWAAQEGTPEAENYDPHTVRAVTPTRKLSSDGAWVAPTLRIAEVHEATKEASRLNKAFMQLMSDLILARSS